MIAFINKLNRKKFIIYSLLTSITLIFLPWVFLYFSLNSKNILYSGFKYSSIAIIASLILSIFYEKKKGVIFLSLALLLIFIILVTFKNVLLAIFFTGLGPWRLG